MLKNWVRVESVCVPMVSKYNLHVHTNLDNAHDEIAIIRTSLLTLCDKNFCAAIILDDMYYCSYSRYDYMARENRRNKHYQPDYTIKTNIPELINMMSGMFDEETVIIALDLIASKGYADITIEQGQTIKYVFYHSIIDADLDLLKGETISTGSVYIAHHPQKEPVSIQEEPIQQTTPQQLEPQRVRRSENKAVKFHNKRAETIALPATLTLEQWKQTLEDFSYKCAYCLDGNYDVLEHFIPLIFGGGTTAYNCVPACNSCNGIKSDQHPSMISSSRIAEGLQRVKQYLENRKNS
jgi:5-methylcytosine-specific restriction endonuclease McrA